MAAQREDEPAMARATDGCAIYLPKKKRWCRFPLLVGSVFCPHHAGTIHAPTLVVECAPEGMRRVPCPCDPRHSVFESRLEGHLRICSTIKQQTELDIQPWYRPDLHALAPETDTDDGEGAHFDLDGLSPATLCALVERLRAAHASIAVGRFCDAPVVVAPAQLSNQGKHVVQSAAIAARALDGAPADASPSVYIELGAGNACLSEALALATGAIAAAPAAEPAAHAHARPPTDRSKGRRGRAAAVDPAVAARATFLLVDRIVPRRKSDRLLGEAGLRLKTDLAHLDLAGVAQLWAQPGRRRCALAKHLCGGAADVTLRAVTHRGALEAAAAMTAGAAEPPPACAFDDITIATCCHHRCSWATYANREALLAWGFERESFPVLCALSHWAVETKCGRPPSGPRETEADVAEEEDDEGACEHAPPSSKTAQALRTLATALALDVGARTELGLLAKEVLDAGRAAFLERHGYTAWVERGFVPTTVSPENRLLRARPQAQRRTY
jgi:tRNA:m4X modification enzyme